MAQRYRRPGSPFWWAKFQIDGQTHRFSTRTVRRSEASAELARRMAAARGELSMDRLLERLVQAIWKRFRKWIQRTHPAKTSLDSITATTAEEYASDLIRARVGPSTFNAHVTFLQSVFRALRHRAGLTENVWEDIPRREGATRGRRELKPDELLEVIRAAPADLQTLFLVGAYTGMRLGDAFLRQIRVQAAAKNDFAFETTLAGTRMSG